MEGDKEAAKSISKTFKVSIHALTWRATTKCSKVNASTESFNPRPHMEGDQTDRVRLQYDNEVSIHALTWRATSNNCEWVIYLLFQSTPSHGGRQQNKANFRIAQMFQSTPSHGGRRIHLGRLVNRLTSFNPRPHMEGDHIYFPFFYLL